MMRLIKIVLVIGLLGLHFSGKAQSQQEYVYQDSSMLKDTISTDSISGTIVEKATDQLLQNYTSRFQKDTVLVYNQLTVSPDSMKLLSQADTAFSTQVVDSSLRMLHKKALNEQEDEPNQGRGGTKNHHNNDTSIFSSNIFRIVIWTLAISFVLYILFQLFFSQGVFLRKSKKAPPVVVKEDPDELNLSTDYETLKTKAAKAGDYRMAVRYHYLNTLQKLTNKALLVFSPDKTNYQYVRELSGKPMGPAFARLTLDYEYVWFGKFELDEALYQQINHHFSQFFSNHNLS